MKSLSTFVCGIEALIAISMVTLLVMACGGGGGGGGASPAATTSLTVTPMKGQFCAGAQVTAYDANNAAIGSASVNSNGIATLSVPANAAVPLHLTVGAGSNGSCYWDEALGSLVSIPAQTTTLNALLHSLQTAAASGVGITFFTELAYQNATSSVPVTGLTASGVQAANAMIAAQFGLAASGVADVLTPPTLIGQNTPKIASTTSAGDVYALAVATMARISASSAPAQVATLWLNRARANPASGVAGLPETQGWGAAWSAATSGASSVLAPGVMAPQPPALSATPFIGPTISFSSANIYVATNGLSGNFTASGSVSVNGISVPLTGSGTITLGSATQTMLNGTAALQQTQTVSGSLWSSYGTFPFGGISTSYSNPATHAEMASISTGSYTSYPVFTYPASMRAGDGGALVTATVYSDNSKSTTLGTERHSYAVAPDTASSLLLTYITDRYNTGNLHDYWEQDTFRVALNGTVTPVSIRMIDYGLTGTSFDLTIAFSPTAVQPPAPAPAPPSPPAPPPAPTFNPPFYSPLPPLSQSVAYQIDYAHSGQASLTGPIAFPNPATPAWSMTLGGAVSYPLIAGGKVFVLTGGLNGGYGTNLYALNLANGSIAWGPVAISGTYFWAGHAYDHGKLFVVNYNGLLKSFDANTGVAGWSTQLPGQYAFSSPPTAINGAVYVGGAGSGGTLYAVDESNGNVLWTQAVANGDKSSPALSSDGVFVSYPCQVYKFNPLNGTSLWHYSGGCSGGGGKTAAYANGLLYVRDWSSANLAFGQVTFDAATGTQVGSFTAATTIPAITAQSEFILSAGTLRGIGLASHNSLWSFAGDGGLVSAPIVINNLYVIVGSSSGNVYALDSTTGAQIWSGNAGAAITAPDEQNVAQPLTGLGAGESYLIVPAGNKLTAWKIGP